MAVTSQSAHMFRLFTYILTLNSLLNIKYLTKSVSGYFPSKIPCYWVVPTRQICAYNKIWQYDRRHTDSVYCTAVHIPSQYARVSNGCHSLKVSLALPTPSTTVAYRRGVWGVQTPLPPTFRSFAKAEPNSQLRGIYIRNNLIRIWVSFICKLSGTPD
jgi:hypothetical protein